MLRYFDPMPDLEDTSFDADHDEWAWSTTRILSMYTQIEGYLEDIGFRYLETVPDAVVDALVSRQPWSSETLRKLLKAVSDRETLDSPDMPAVFKEIGPGRSYAFADEWNWMTRVRNDLAHTYSQYAGPGRFGLLVRTRRHKLRELPAFLTLVELDRHVLRAEHLQAAVIELACYLGVPGLGWKGPGPRPS